MEYEILLRKGLDLSVGMFAMLVGILNSIPPSVLSFVCLIFGLYRCFPTIFHLLVSLSPVIICTAFFLGCILSFGNLNFIPEIEKENQEEELNKNTHHTREIDDLALEDDDKEWIFISAETDDKLTMRETSLTNHGNGEVDNKILLHEGEGACEGGKKEIEDVEVEGSEYSSKGSFESWTEHMKVHYGSDSYGGEDTSSSAPSEKEFTTVLLEECKPLLDGHFSLSDSDYTLEQSVDDDDTSIDSDELEEEWGIVERRDGKILVGWGIDDAEDSLRGQQYPNQIGEDSDSSEAEVERYSYLELISGISRLEESKVKAFNCKLPPEPDFSVETGLKLPSLKTRPLEDINSALNLLHERETPKHIDLESYNPRLVFLEDENEPTERWLSNEDHLILELPVHNVRTSVELLVGGVREEPSMVESVVDKPEMLEHECQIPNDPESHVQSGFAVGDADLVPEKLTEDGIKNSHESSESEHGVGETLTDEVDPDVWGVESRAHGTRTSAKNQTLGH